MSPILICLIIVTHFTFDWLQPRWVQNNKHHDILILMRHVLISTLPFTFVLYFFYGAMETILLWFVFFLSHILTDYITSRLAHQAKKNKKEWNLIAITAVDQMIHLLTYVLLCVLITNIQTN